MVSRNSIDVIPSTSVLDTPVSAQERGSELVGLDMIGTLDMTFTLRLQAAAVPLAAQARTRGRGCLPA